MSDFDENLLRRWMVIQQQRVTVDGVANRVVLVLDDMAASQALRYANIISELSYNGRHLQIGEFFECVFTTTLLINPT